LQFASPVAVVAGTTYVVSYVAPNGHYSISGGFFAAGYSNGPLSAPAGANGVYLYGSGSFPTQSYNNSNYWVDPIFTTSAPADTTPPSVTSQVPAAGASGVATSVAPSATFSEAVSSSVVFTVKDGSGSAVAGSVGLSSGNTVATFTPSAALAAGTAYTASVSASDTSGNAMPAPVSWTFTTAGLSCPCTLFASGAVPGTVDSGDPSAVNLGVRFVPSVSGYVTGVRFYKAAANTGTHTGSLWLAAGNQRLATGVFANETGSGWQTLQFASPVAVTGGTSYLVTYFAPNGHYSISGGFFATDYSNGPLSAPAGANGSYLYGSDGFPAQSYNNSNYWVDPIFTTTAP
jgi:hypothetical protein